MRSPRRPDTAVPWRTAGVGFLGFSAGAVLGLVLHNWPPVALVSMLMCTAFPMWWIEARRKPPRVLDCSPPVKAIAAPQTRRAWRLRGLMAAAPIWAITLNVIQLGNPSILSGFWSATISLSPLLLIGAFFYLYRLDNNAPQGLELAGRWVTERQTPFPWHVLRDHLVKAFFLPLMLAFAYGWSSQSTNWSLQSPLQVYTSIIALLYLVDTAFGTVGYLSTSRRLGAHLRSSNPYWLAWGAALICYPPFFGWLQQIGVQYRDGRVWSDWIAPDTVLFHSWAACIIGLTAIYVLSTVVFGPRFSNLTHRGIITHGPYRFIKHPAYVSKNLSWWLISMPFLSASGAGTAFLHCLALCAVNGIYFVRAKTEERHLMHDPVYRAYSAWIDAHGLWAVLRRKMQRGPRATAPN